MLNSVPPTPSPLAHDDDGGDFDGGGGGDDAGENHTRETDSFNQILAAKLFTLFALQLIYISISVMAVTSTEMKVVRFTIR